MTGILARLLSREQHDVFLSYSRQDEVLVNGIVKLLRVSRVRTFLDSDSIEPGEDWRQVIAGSIRASRATVVFWCNHSAESEHVRSEYRFAIEARSQVVPALLDHTPLPQDLGAYQAIDLAGMAAPWHGRDAPLSGSADGEARPVEDLVDFLRGASRFSALAAAISRRLEEL